MADIIGVSAASGIEVCELLLCKAEAATALNNGIIVWVVVLDWFTRVLAYLRESA